MLGVQHTRAAATTTATTTHQHYPPSRPAAPAASPVPTPPKSKKLGGLPALPSQKAGTLTHSSVNNKSSALHELELPTGTPELGVDDIIAWPDIPREDADEDDEGTRETDPGRGGEGLVDGEGDGRPVLDGASDDARQNAGADGAARSSGSDLHDKSGGEEGADGAEIDVRRMSSPLSELSPAPSNIDEEDREQDRNTTGGPDKSGSLDENPAAEPRAGANVNGNGNGNVDPMSGSRRPDRVSPLSAAAAHSAGPSSAAAPSPLTTTYFPSSPSLSQQDRSTLPPSSPAASSQTQLPRTTSTPQASSPGRYPPSANAQAGPSRSGIVNGDGVPPPSPLGSFSSKGSANLKGTSIIELNAELFRVCMAFQAQGIAMNAPDAQPFWRKLSSNLTWLAAHVDNTKTTLEVEIPLPDMDAPVLTANAMNMNLPNDALDRINTLYAQLPVLFAKDIARKERRSSQGPGTPTPSVPGAPPGTPGALSHLRNSATPSLLPPSGIGVKRERSDGRESPAAAKRRDMGEGKRSTPAPPGAMLPPATPEHSQHMQRPGSAMSAGVSPLNPMAGRPMSRGGPMLSPAHSGSSGGDPTSAGGMFATATAISNASSMPMGGGMPNSQNMQNLQNMQNMRDIQNLAGLQGVDAQARQMQFRQAMMYQQQRQQQQQQAQLQQQQQQQQQQHQQHQQHQQQQQQQHQQQHQQHALQSGQTSMSMSMSPPQTQAQAQPSQQQQQIMQAQAAARQMSPPGAQTASGMVGVNNVNMNSMGVNNNGQNQIPLGVPNQAGNMNMAMPGAQAQAGAGTASANAQVLQQIANAGPAAVATYQALQNPQHPMVQYLNQSMPGFSGLPIMEQMRRWQIMQTNMQQRQQQNQRNQLMPNQMAAGQMRQVNTGVSGSGPSQMQQHGQTSQIGMSHQMQQQPLTEGMQFSSAAGMPNRAAGVMGMGMPNQMAGMTNMANMSNLNPQQRQLYLLQMQQARAAVAAGNTGMNPAMMTPQMLATAQERARLEQQQRFALAQRQGSPLNPAAASVGAGAGSADQFPPGLRSNPALPGIARSARSPSVSADLSGGTPRIGMRGLPGQVVPGSGTGGNDEYHRALMQAQRNAQMQSLMSGTGQGGAGPGAWSNANSQQQQMPLSAGAWPQSQQSQQGHGAQQNFSMSGSPPAGMRTVELSGTPRQSSTTPAPMTQQSPTSMQTPEFDSMMNW